MEAKMQNIEEVKKILYKASPAAGVIDLDITCLAKEICKLFELKPDRLLTKDEIFEAIKELAGTIPFEEWLPPIIASLKAQRALTAFIKDAECQERIKGIFEEIEAEFDYSEELIKSVDASQRLIPVKLARLPVKSWQALKKQLNIEG